MYSPPDKPLIVKCTYDRWHKRINFNSARNCSYDVLRHKVEECFSLSASSYAISYKDDDGEITNIATDADLIEAIQYFQAGDDAPLSSAASILSGRSFGGRRITVRVTISVDYDGPSLSDTSSLASLEEFKGRNGSQHSFSFGAPSVDLDDDSVTVSSRDPGPSSVRALGNSVTSLAKKSSNTTFQNKNSTAKEVYGHSVNGHPRSQHIPSTNGHSQGGLGRSSDECVSNERYPADPSAVFERLKLSENLRDDSSSIDFDYLAASERGAAWLRDQNERTIRSKLGALPEPSESDNLSLSLGSQHDPLGGDLALERDPRGKYYYSYTGSAGSQFQGSGDEEAQNTMSDGDIHANNVVRGPRPTSMQLNWLATQQIESAQNQRRNNDVRSISIQEESATHAIDKDLLPFLPVAGPHPEMLTDCSNCGTFLDAIRYVCSTCGEKSPVIESTYGKGKEKDSSPQSAYFYPPPTLPIFSSPNSSSSRTYVGSSESFFDIQCHKPLPSIPSAPSLLSVHSMLSSSPTNSSPTKRSNFSSPTSSQTSAGYELCSGCLESAGIHHAIEAGLSPPGSSPSIGSMSPSHDDPQRASQWRRAAPKKGQLRHSYREKVWGHMGWEDVVQDEAKISRCSTCAAITPRKRYKCASCPKIHLCRACYSQVHELHPSHAFLIVPDKPAESPSSSDYLMPEVLEELSLKHPGVKCAHCLLDIVGARFHCAICDSVDICSHCESAGLPGNLDSSDGGHNSSHILIKIPYPLETTELQSASRRALHLWSKDAANVGFAAPRSKAESEISYAHTLIVPSPRDGLSHSPGDHRILCNNCHRMIVGVRYQCGHCPTSPSSFNLCSNCEERSYFHHDPSHVFFKLPRPVDRPLEPVTLPPLYILPAGPPPNVPQLNDPKVYLASLYHSAAICDRCMTCIEGAWFRCCYCPRDLCWDCQEVDTHDDTHIFLVFKSLVDMQVFKSFANLDNPDRNSPVLSYPLYR